MARTQNIVQIQVRLNPDTLVQETLSFPVDQDPDEIQEVIQSALRNIEKALGDALGFEVYEDDNTEEDDEE